jgi:sigma-B regulation protein RsbU (phosphoserine phosphatase)
MNDKGTILAVDDTPANLKLLVDTLSAEGYQVRSLDSGERAIAEIVARPPELILLDIHMQGMDGLQVCRWLKAQENLRDIPVMFISAASEMKDRVEGLRLGAVDYIPKPFQREEMLARVHTHLELSRLRTRQGKLIQELEAALASVRQLRGLLPICASCKNVRDDKGYWSQIEVYISEHSEAEFSHGLCPVCYNKAMKEVDQIKKKGP